MSEFILVPQATGSGFMRVGRFGCFDWSYPGSATRRGRVQGNGEVSPTITCSPEIYVFMGYEEI